MAERTVYVHTLSRPAVRTARAHANGESVRLVYLHAQGAAQGLRDVLGQAVRAEPIELAPSLDLREAAYAQTNAWAAELARNPDLRAALAPVLAKFHTQGAHLEAALWRLCADAVGPDAELAALARAAGAQQDAVYLVQDAPLFAYLDTNLQVAPLYGSRLRHGRSLAQALGALLAGAAWPPDPLPLEADAQWTILFEQAFDRPAGNPDFLAWYAYLRTRTDVLYHCPNPASRIRRHLEAEGRPVVSHRVCLRGKARARALAGAARIARMALRGPAPRSVLARLARLLRDELHYESLLAAYRPRYFVKVRADLDPAHPILTACQERLGARHVGYQHGLYLPGQTAVQAADFHVLGLCGAAFGEPAFASRARADMHRLVLGPFTGPSIEACAARKPSSAGPAVALFPTTFGPYDLPARATEAFFAASYQALGPLDAQVVVKDKVYDPRVDEAERAARAGTDLRVRKVYSLADGAPQAWACGRDYTLAHADAVLEACDVAVVMWISSTVLEALAAKRKVLVYMLGPGRHPLAPDLGNLVVRARADLADRLRWLVDLPQAEYERIIASCLARWGKPNHGRLAAQFWEAVEALPAPPWVREPAPPAEPEAEGTP